MNVYDFDKTIFYPDSSACFFRYCLRHYPRAVLRVFPDAGAAGLLWLLGREETKELKETLFSFLPYLDNVEQIVREFWTEYRSHIGSWYLSQRRETDLIISASPEFLLCPAADALGVRLIATRMDRYTGQIQGNNCHDTVPFQRVDGAV